MSMSCCWYHKGTNFQANHNRPALVNLMCGLLLIPQRYEFSSKSQRTLMKPTSFPRCCWYHKGTNFQANHNMLPLKASNCIVVADTTKVRIFKQITTSSVYQSTALGLLLIPQRYEFSSKSQPLVYTSRMVLGCCWYHKGTNFQANHNNRLKVLFSRVVVADTTKVRIFKQITTEY